MARQTFVVGDVTIQCIVEEPKKIQATIHASSNPGAAISMSMTPEQAETVGNLFTAMAQAARKR